MPAIGLLINLASDVPSENAFMFYESFIDIN